MEATQEPVRDVHGVVGRVRDPETVRHLLHALLAFTRAAGYQPADLGHSDDVEAILNGIKPKRTR